MTYDPAFSKITDDEWREHVRGYDADNSFSWNNRKLGARPGHDGCRVPPHILDDLGYPQVFKFEPKQQRVNGDAERDNSQRRDDLRDQSPQADSPYVLRWHGEPDPYAAGQPLNS